MCVASDAQLWGFLDHISWAGGQFKLPARDDLNKKLRWRIAQFLVSHRRGSSLQISRAELERGIGRGMFETRFGRLSVSHTSHHHRQLTDAHAQYFTSRGWSEEEAELLRRDQIKRRRRSSEGKPPRSAASSGSSDSASDSSDSSDGGD